MPYFGRHRDRNSRPARRLGSRCVLEPLEERTMLSSSGPALAPVPTTTVLQVSTTNAVASESITLTASVENANRQIPITSGRVRFVVESPKPRFLGQATLNKAGDAGITTDDLSKVGSYQLEAEYIPTGTRIARSYSALVNVTVSPLMATSFFVTPDVRHGSLTQPLSFTVTALNAQGQPVTDYTGTVSLSSPTDSWTRFSRGFLIGLESTAEDEGIKLADLIPVLPPTTGLATFPVEQYTFTPADHGTHTFVDGVSFDKAGAEVVKVTQANDAKVDGKATFAIE